MEKPRALRFSFLCPRFAPAGPSLETHPDYSPTHLVSRVRRDFGADTLRHLV